MKYNVRYDDINRQAAIRKAQEIGFKYPGLSKTLIKRLSVQFRCDLSDNYPENNIAYLVSSLPAYGFNYEQSIEFINNSILLLFADPRMLESKLAMLHMVDAEKEILMNHQSVLLKGKLKDIYSVAKELKFVNKNSDICLEDKTKMDYIVANTVSEEKNENMFKLSSNELYRIISKYRQFIKEQKNDLEATGPELKKGL